MSGWEPKVGYLQTKNNQETLASVGTNALPFRDLDVRRSLEQKPRDLLAAVLSL